MLSPEEQYRFDLHGYILVRNVVPKSDIDRMKALCEEWNKVPDEQLPPPLHTYRDKNTKQTTARAINGVEYIDEAFQRLVLNPAILHRVCALTRNSPQLLGVALTRNTKESDDIPFHGGVSGFWNNPANDYQATAEGPFATFLNAAVTLVDVPQGMGFVCVPGSHKARYAKPDDITIYTDPPTVVNVCPNAGDLVLFSETLCHGARKWTADYPRMTVFARYGTSYASWSPGHGPDEKHRHMLPEEVAELMSMRGFQTRKKVVERILAESA